MAASTTSSCAPSDREAKLYKTRLCAPFEATKFCPYGPRCMYAHGVHELRTVDANEAAGFTTWTAICDWQRSEAARRKKQLRKMKKRAEERASRAVPERELAVSQREAAAAVVDAGGPRLSSASPVGHESRDAAASSLRPSSSRTPPASHAGSACHHHHRHDPYAVSSVGGLSSISPSPGANGSRRSAPPPTGSSSNGPAPLLSGTPDAAAAAAALRTSCAPSPLVGGTSFGSTSDGFGAHSSPSYPGAHSFGAVGAGSLRTNGDGPIQQHGSLPPPPPPPSALGLSAFVRRSPSVAAYVIPDAEGERTDLYLES